MQSPEAIAAAVVGAWYAGPYPLHHDTAETEIADVAAALRAYGATCAAAERERCASVVDAYIRAAYYGQLGINAADISAALRANATDPGT